MQAWERNESVPRPKTLTQISRVLGQSPTFFFTDWDPEVDDADEPDAVPA